MKIFSDEFMAACLEQVSDTRKPCTDVAEELFKDWLKQFDKAERNTRLGQLAGCINLLAKHDYPEKCNVEIGRGAGFGMIGQGRNSDTGMKSDLTLTEDLETMILTSLEKYRKVIPKAGVSLSFFGDKLSAEADPSVQIRLSKQLAALVGQVLDSGKVKGMYREGRTLYLGVKPVEVEESADQKVA